MKPQNIYLWKLVLLLVVPIVTSCSIHAGGMTTETTPLSIVAADTSIAATDTPINMPTPLPLRPPIGKIAFVSEDSYIDVINSDGSVKTILAVNLGGLELAWSPDGQSIAFASGQSGFSQIYVMKADGSDQRQLTSGNANSDSPAWSPDGKNIIFISDQAGILTEDGIPISQVYIMKADGTKQQRLTHTHDFEREVAWSPKRDVLAISANVLTPSGIYFPEEIYLMGLGGVLQKGLTTSPYTANPVWSPNGQLIAFTSSQDSGIYVMKADGSDQVPLITSTNTNSSSQYVNNLHPSWSPDGNYIVFSSNRDGHYQLYIMKADGSDLIRLTNDPDNDMSPVWSPVP